MKKKVSYNIVGESQHPCDRKVGVFRIIDTSSEEINVVDNYKHYQQIGDQLFALFPWKVENVEVLD